MTIRILIADDHPMVRQGLRTFLELHDDLEVVGEAADGEEALQGVHQLSPDVLLLDVMMPRRTGLEVLEELAQQGLECRTLFLTSVLNPDQALKAVELGAGGFLTKDLEPAALAEAIRKVHQGEPQLHPEVTKRLISQAIAAKTRPPEPKDLLTERELEILKLIATGMSNKEIGQQLYISEKTVKTHMSSILDKLNLKDRTQAALYAVREKLV